MTAYKKSMKQALLEMRLTEHSDGTDHPHPHEDDEDEIDQEQQQNLQDASVNMNSPVMLDLLRLYNKAMNAVPGSSKQMGYRKEIEKIRKSMGMKEEVELDESVIDKVKEIDAKKSAKKIDGVMVDSFTASAISQIYDKVSDANKKKMDKLPIKKLADLAMKFIKHGEEFVPEEVDLDEGTMNDVIVMRKGRVSVSVIANAANVKKKEKEGFKIDGVIEKGSSLLHKEPKRIMKAIKGGDKLNIGEGTWKVPETRIDQMALRKALRKPIKAKDAEKVISKHIGDDSLFDDFYDLEKDDPNQDVRPLIRNRMKELGIKEEVELDEAIDKKTAKIIAKMIARDKFDYNFEYSLSIANIDDIKKQGGKPPRGVRGDKMGFLGDILEPLGAEDIYLDGDDLVDGSKTIGKWKGMSVGDMFKKARVRYEEVDLEEGKMAQMHQMMKDKKTPEQIAKAMKLDLKTVKALMSGYNESAASDARRAMMKDKDLRRGKDSADDDDDATDDDIKAASKNIMMQMRKAQSLKGRFDVEFQNKKKKKVPAQIAQAVQSKYNSLRRPAEKQAFQSKVAQSYEDMLKALKEDYVLPIKKTILDRIDEKLLERKND